jgi:hypothetical protein
LTLFGFPEAVKQSRVIMDILRSAVSSEQLEKARKSLPTDCDELFAPEVTDPLSPSFEGLSKATGEEFPKVETPPQGDIFQLLKAETNKIMRVMKKLRDSSAHQPQEREALTGEARARILAKNRIEERHLHPLLDIAPDGKQLLDHYCKQMLSYTHLFISFART